VQSSLARFRRPAPPEPWFRCRTDVFDQAARDLGITDAEFARFLRLDKVTFWSVVRKGKPAGHKFCAHVLAAFPGEKFERFFEVVEVDS
jgi:hypothetical protein